MKRTRKIRSNSTESQLREAAGYAEGVPVPEGVDLTTKFELLLWHQFTRARPVSEWREFDLYQIAIVVENEITIRELKKQVKKTGRLVEAINGIEYMHPILKDIDMLRKQNLAICKSMSLGIYTDARQANRNGKKAFDVEKDKALAKSKKGSLLKLAPR